MSSRLRAAAGAVELRPVVGTRLTGFARRLSPSIGVHDPLMGKLLLLDDGSTRLLWVALDLIGLSVEDDALLRQLLAERVSIPPANVFVSCTHTHSGPTSMRFRGPLGHVETPGMACAFNEVAGEAAGLVAKLRPAHLAHATTIVEGIGYNRQDAASAIDERLLVVQVRGADDGQAIATILNYATHPVVLGEHNLMFSADYPGAATRLVEDAIGGVALFVLGSAGDVDPVVYRDRGRDAGSFQTAEEYGRRLGEAAVRATRTAQAGSDESLHVVETRVLLHLDPPPSSKTLETIKAQIGRNDGAEWRAFELAWAEELGRALASDRVPKTVAVHLAAARLGGVYTIAFPLEVYSQIGLDLREQLAPSPLIVAGYTNGLIGYAPTDRAIEQGGYGPAVSYRFFPHLITPLARGTHATLLEAGAQLVRSLSSPERALETAVGYTG